MASTLAFCVLRSGERVLVQRGEISEVPEVSRRSNLEVVVDHQRGMVAEALIQINIRFARQ
jgi:hypothetical protein